MSSPLRLLHEMLLRTNEKHSTSVAIIFDNKSYTYETLLNDALKFGSLLKTRGITRGDRVALFIDNTYTTAVGLFGTLLAGGVFVIINPQTKSDKLEYILKNCDAKGFISDIHLASTFESVLPKISSLSCTILTGNLIDQGTILSNLIFVSFDTSLNSQPLLEPTPVISLDLAALIYTSGSTGEPKGVMMTHQSMVFTTQSLTQYLMVNQSDTLINVLPFAFDYGLYQLLVSIYAGASLVVEKSFTYPAAVFAHMQTYKVTTFPGVPTIYTTLIAMHRRSKLSFPNVLRITNTAAALPADYNAELKEIFPNAEIFRMYGLTECKRVCYLNPKLVEIKPDSVGKAIPGTETFLLSPEGAPVPIGTAGILYVRGAHIMQGYWKDPIQTAKMLKPWHTGNEMMLCTNDWFKEDKNGDLYFLGRSDDIIKTRGEKVSPIEVETVLLSLKGVREAAVVGVKDALLGESIKAFVSLDNKALTERDILKHCTMNLENFMVPKSVEILESLPKTDTGKITKKNLH